MAKSRERFNKRRLSRDEKIKTQYKKLQDEGKYKESYIINELADKFFLETRTIEAIVWGEYERNLQKKLEALKEPVDPNQLKLFADEV